MASMEVPTYDELLEHFGMDALEMEQIIQVRSMKTISCVLKLREWESFADHLGLEDPDIENLTRCRRTQDQIYSALKYWRQRCGFKATFKSLTNVLLDMKRTDLAEEIVKLKRSVQSPEASMEQVDIGYTSPSSGASKRSWNLPAEIATSPTTSVAASPCLSPDLDITSTLNQLEIEFYTLVRRTEDDLEKSDIRVTVLTRRFSMLSQAVKNKHSNDDNFPEISQRILDSTSVKKLFDNLTKLKYWNYMAPETLADLLKDDEVEIDVTIREDITRYERKLSEFKMNTKVKEMIVAKVHDHVPIFCYEIIVKAEKKEWEDKTIYEAERAVVNMLNHVEDRDITPRFNMVESGCLKLTFVLLDSITSISDVLLNATKCNGVISIELEGDVLYTSVQPKLKMANLESAKITEDFKGRLRGAIDGWIAKQGQQEGRLFIIDRPIKTFIEKNVDVIQKQRRGNSLTYKATMNDKDTILVAKLRKLLRRAASGGAGGAVIGVVGGGSAGAAIGALIGIVGGPIGVGIGAGIGAGAGAALGGAAGAIPGVGLAAYIVYKSAEKIPVQMQTLKEHIEGQVEVNPPNIIVTCTFTLT